MEPKLSSINLIQNVGCVFILSWSIRVGCLPSPHCRSMGCNSFAQATEATLSLKLINPRLGGTLVSVQGRLRGRPVCHWLSHSSEPMKRAKLRELERTVPAIPSPEPHSNSPFLTCEPYSVTDQRIAVSSQNWRRMRMHTRTGWSQYMLSCLNSY